MKTTIMKDAGANVAASIRIALATILLCGGLYPLLIFGFARLMAPESASGSLLRDQSGRVAGSRLIAQGFTRPDYFWPRPSAVKYNAGAAGGSNLSPAGPEVRDRTAQLVRDFGANRQTLLPADLASASGSGLDPFITLRAALFEAPRVARARGMTLSEVEMIVRRQAAGQQNFWSGEGLVNVLAVNMELDAMKKKRSFPD